MAQKWCQKDGPSDAKSVKAPKKKSLFYAPRNILIRTPPCQIVLQYQQHETFYTFALRNHLTPSTLCTPLGNTIHPSTTLQQLHLQHRFLRSKSDISSLPITRTPNTYVTFQSQQMHGSFYLIDDMTHFVCIVNWTLGKATGSYHTKARTLKSILQEWHPLTPFFHILPLEDEIPFHPEDPIHSHRKIHFTLLFLVPFTYELFASIHQTLHSRPPWQSVLRWTIYTLYHLSLDKLSLTIGSFALYSSNTLLTREHLCKHLPNTTLHLFYTSDGPQFSSPTSFPGLHSLICLQYAQTHPTPSPVTSPDRPQVYQYLLTGALGRNFAILPTPTLQALRTYLLRHFGTNNFTYILSKQSISRIWSYTTHY